MDSLLKTTYPKDKILLRDYNKIIANVIGLHVDISNEEITKLLIEVDVELSESYSHKNKIISIGYYNLFLNDLN